MFRLTVFIPDLLNEMLGQFNGAVDGQRWPLCNLILSRACEHPLECSVIESNLCTLFGPAPPFRASLSVSNLTASIDSPDNRSAGIMRADPVHLRADPTQILLFNDPSIMPSTLEADALIKILNSGLPEFGLCRGRHPARWYFCPKEGSDAITVPPSRVNGRSITNFLPSSSGADGFVKMMHEAQILLHEAPINVERTARGLPTINSIWIWGDELPHNALGTTPRFVIGDDVLTAALARRFKLDWSVDRDPTELLSRITRGDGDGLVVLGAPTGAIKCGGRASGIEAFERRWSQPILNSLRWFRLAELRVVTDRETFSLTPWRLRKFWCTQYMPPKEKF